MTLLPMWIVALVAFVYGSVIGSFSAMLVSRMHTGKSLNTRSRCLSCGKPLAWYELIPVVSYLSLRARCNHCDARIPRRDFLIETSLGIIYAGIILLVPNLIAALLSMLFATVLMIIAAYDLRHLIIPDELVLIAVGIAALMLGYHSYVSADISIAILGGIAGLLAAFAYALLWLVSGGRWIGLGDAKLALPLGMMVGLQGVFSMIVLSFWVGAVLSMAIILITHASSGQRSLRFVGTPLKMKSEVPFAPFLVIAFALVYFFGIDVLTLTAYVLSF